MNKVFLMNPDEIIDAMISKAAQNNDPVLMRIVTILGQYPEIIDEMLPDILIRLIKMQSDRSAILSSYIRINDPCAEILELEKEL